MTWFAFFVTWLSNNSISKNELFASIAKQFES
jgi:hypothetical protein